MALWQLTERLGRDQGSAPPFQRLDLQLLVATSSDEANELFRKEEPALAVIPVALSGTRHVLPPGSVLPRPGRIEITIGAPLVFDSAITSQPPGKARRLITDRVMAAIRELSGQEYVDMFASEEQETLLEYTSAQNVTAGVVSNILGKYKSGVASDNNVYNAANNSAQLYDYSVTSGVPVPIPSGLWIDYDRY